MLRDSKVHTFWGRRSVLNIARYLDNQHSGPLILARLQQEAVLVTQQAIAEINKQLCEAFRLGDAGLYVSHCTENVRLLPAGHPMITGKQAVRDFWQAAMNEGARNLHLDIAYLETIGDTAIEIGTFALLWDSEGGQGKREIGKYVVIWKYQTDQSWKLAVDIFNLDTPNMPH